MDIEIKQRKNCGSCRALGNSRHYPNCSLGYKITPTKTISGIYVDAKPDEPCPKPLTVTDFVECIRNYKR
jgi:hypothetical protein